MSEWLTQPLGSLAAFQKGRKVETSEHPRDGFAPYLGASAISGVVEEYGDARIGVMAAAGDVLMLWDGERSGLVGKAQVGVISSTVARLSPKAGVEGDYLYYALDSKFEWIQGHRTGTGVPHVPKDLARILSISYPKDKREQRRIAEILSTVDEAIEQTEALIAKYRQIKAGLMHDLFTRGVTSDGHLRPPRAQAPRLYKDSPVGWIPKEWEVVSFGSCLVCSPQNGLYKPATDYGDSGTPIVRINSFYEGVIDSLKELRRLRLTTGEAVLYALAHDEILVNRVNSIDYVGKSAIVPELDEQVVFESNIMRCRLDRVRIIPEFAIRWLCFPAATLYFHSRAKSAIAQASINQTDVKSLPTILPNQEEQRQICERAVNLDISLTLENQCLHKLRQLKHGLMHDLLTGRVRVKVAEPQGAPA